MATTPNPSTKYTEQVIQNLSFDSVYNVSTVEMLAEDLAGNAVRRLQADSSGFLKVNVAAGGTSGTQYADATARGTATGNLMMVDDGVNIQSASGDTAGRLNTNVIGAGSNAQIKDDSFYGDGVTSGLLTSHNRLWNGTAYDRSKSVVDTMDTPTGVASAGLVAQLDDTATSPVTENQFGPVRMSTRRALLFEGVAAQGASVLGNPVLSAAEARDTLGTAVSTGQVSRLSTNRYGIQLFTALPPSHASSNGTPITSTTTSVVGAPSVGSHLRVLRIHISNGGATSTWVGVRDGAAGTQHYRTFLPQNGVVSIDLNMSGPLDLTTATRLDIVLSAAGSVEYEVDYLTVAD